MATNSNVPAVEAGVFGRRRRGNASSRPSRLVDAQELWDIDDVASYLGVTKQTIYSWRTAGCRRSSKTRPLALWQFPGNVATRTRFARLATLGTAPQEHGR